MKQCIFAYVIKVPTLKIQNIVTKIAFKIKRNIKKTNDFFKHTKAITSLLVCLIENKMSLVIRAFVGSGDSHDLCHH